MRDRVRECIFRASGGIDVENFNGFDVCTGLHTKTLDVSLLIFDFTQTLTWQF